MSVESFTTVPRYFGSFTRQDYQAFANEEESDNETESTVEPNRKNRLSRNRKFSPSSISSKSLKLLQRSLHPTDIASALDADLPETKSEYSSLYPRIEQKYAHDAGERHILHALSDFQHNRQAAQHWVGYAVRSSSDTPVAVDMGKPAGGLGFQPTNTLSKSCGSTLLTRSRPATNSNIRLRDRSAEIDELRISKKAKLSDSDTGSRRATYETTDAAPLQQRMSKSKDSAVDGRSVMSMSQSNSLGSQGRRNRTGKYSDLNSTSDYKMQRSRKSTETPPDDVKTTAQYSHNSATGSRDIENALNPLEDDCPSHSRRRSTKSLKSGMRPLRSAKDEDRRISFDPLQTDELGNPPILKSAISMSNVARPAILVRGLQNANVEGSEEEDELALGTLKHLENVPKSVMKKFEKESSSGLSRRGDLRPTSFTKSAESTLPASIRNKSSAGELRFPVISVTSGHHRHASSDLHLSYFVLVERNLILFDATDKQVESHRHTLNVNIRTLQTFIWCYDRPLLQIKRAKASNIMGNETIYIEFDQAKTISQLQMRLIDIDPTIKINVIDDPDNMEKRFHSGMQDHQKIISRQPASPSDDTRPIGGNYHRLQHVEELDALQQTSPSLAKRQKVSSSMMPEDRNNIVVDQPQIKVISAARAQRAKAASTTSKQPTMSTRMTRARSYIASSRDSTPLPEDGWSIKNKDYVKEWSTPLVWPLGEKKRVTVGHADIEKLDDATFLNDVVIEFYLRYLEYRAEKFSEAPKKVHIFNTFFYDKLTSPCFNYDAVKRWTAKIDIFSYDYIIVPVNKDLHWYITIICNPGSLLPPVDNRSSGIAAKDSVEEQQVSSPSGPVQDDEIITKAEPLSMDSPMNQLPLDDQLREENLATQTTAPGSNTEAFSRCEALENDLPHPVKSSKATKGKRKSSGPLRYKEGQTKIIALDSLGNLHGTSSRNVRDWLFAEAKERRGIEVDPDLKLSANGSNLPQQPNFYDCGIYLLAYMEQFFDDPDGFIMKTMMTRSSTPFMQQVDAIKARAKIRDLLLKLRKQQTIDDAKLRREKTKAREQDESQQGANDPEANPIQWWKIRITDDQAKELDVDANITKQKSSLYEKFRHNVNRMKDVKRIGHSEAVSKSENPKSNVPMRNSLAEVERSPRTDGNDDQAGSPWRPLEVAEDQSNLEIEDNSLRTSDESVVEIEDTGRQRPAIQTSPENHTSEHCTDRFQPTAKQAVENDSQGSFEDLVTNLEQGILSAPASPSTSNKGQFQHFASTKGKFFNITSLPTRDSDVERKRYEYKKRTTTSPRSKPSFGSHRRAQSATSLLITLQDELNSQLLPAEGTSQPDTKAQGKRVRSCSPEVVSSSPESASNLKVLKAERPPAERDMMEIIEESWPALPERHGAVIDLEDSHEA